ncbi:hypothetical protein ASJ81_03320 [Methanosarcina spelaei]|uniref:Uncharacterized protein n=1 Tax=Methanosarcina spelaei TaxID=1036679 RepID=A0A2A2HWQ0_9EURY|nr:hypothetical protein ASJ81_03320 [Methanosarcina spelaei]
MFFWLPSLFVIRANLPISLFPMRFFGNLPISSHRLLIFNCEEVRRKGESFPSFNLGFLLI